MKETHSEMLDRLQMALTLATAGPCFLWQARQVRRRVPQLSECFLAQGQRSGSGPPIRLGFIGDSIMAGIGHTEVEGTLVGHLTRLLAEKTGRGVEWHNLAHNGSCSQSLLQLLPADLPQVDLWIVSVGVNDALRLRNPQVYGQNLARLADRSPKVPWLWVGLPNLNDFPCIPYPLRSFLAWRVSKLESTALSLPQPWRSFQLKTRHTLDTFSPDLFHPGALGCRIWAEKLLPTLFQILGLREKIVSLRVIV